MCKVAAIIVTHNRLALLKEAVAAVQQQSRQADDIIVINNGSTDGTTEWLAGQLAVTSVEQPNDGASAGFHTGITMAYDRGADWFWLMDDDTICRPDTLEKLLEKLPELSQQVGFLSSKSIWSDDSPHLMNIPAIKPTFNDKIPFNQFDDLGMLLVETSSFVSLLVSRVAVQQVGLPYREFFIWGDDQEFTRRITQAGYLGLYCPDSVVLHKTAVNYCPDFYRDGAANLFKYSYGFRNEFFMIKKRQGLLYFSCWLPVKLAYTTYRLLCIRDNERLKFLRVLYRSGWRAIFFNPQIQKVA